MMKVKTYYFANQIYQFSYALPIYRRIGGALVMSKLKKLVQLKYYARNLNTQRDVKTFLNTPPVIWRDRRDLYDLRGVILSLSNATINCERERCKKIFIGHGTGDKKYGSSARILEGYDYHFISGSKHLQKLRDVGLNVPEERLIKIGNLRFDDYVNGKIMREQELNRLGISDRFRKNVLYAPTWRWGDGTFMKYVWRFSEEITTKFNLILRPHHHDRRYVPRVKLWAKLKGIKNLYFASPSTLGQSDTFRDFMVSDIMISDTSSILYEYLITRKPIIVAKTDFKDLHKMPDSMNIMNYATIFDGSQDIVELIARATNSEKHVKQYDELLKECFYFNDGRSVDRAIRFIETLENRRGSL